MRKKAKVHHALENVIKIDFIDIREYLFETSVNFCFLHMMKIYPSFEVNGN